MVHCVSMAAGNDQASARRNKASRSCSMVETFGATVVGRLSCVQVTADLVRHVCALPSRMSAISALPTPDCSAAASNASSRSWNSPRGNAGAFLLDPNIVVGFLFQIEGDCFAEQTIQVAQLRGVGDQASRQALTMG